MGKIRVKTLGAEDQEQEEKQKIKARNEAKKIEAAKKKATETGEEVVVADTEKEAKQAKKATYKKAVTKETKQLHSAKYQTAAALVDHNKKYQLTEALELLPKLKLTSFDETVELHINTIEKGIAGNMTLPHGTGKEVRIAIANQTEDAKGVESLIKDIEAGQINFDVLIATPDAMPKLAKVARVLGPRGLMPNPKNGTVTPKPEEVSKKFAGGQVNFKTESKFPIIHLVVGKVSFGDKKLHENIKVAINTVKVKSIKNVTLKSTMSPGLKLEIATIN